jgi:hypothetical protein
MVGAAAPIEGRSGRSASLVQHLADVAAALACGIMVAALIYLAARPLDTSDLWWHLAMGEVYAEVGPWPDGDPLLHTAHADAPVQHEWLFGVALHAVRAVGGFGALRVAHAFAVAAILGLAWALFRDRSATGTGALTCLALCSFVSLAWWRLFQLRPDLFSIAATLLLARWLLDPKTVPGRGRVFAAGALFALWANVHSLFAVGLALAVAALLGCALAGALAASKGVPRDPKASERAKRLAETIALGTLMSLLNPRGAAQLLTFATSSSESAIWLVKDEWTHFDPFRWGAYAGGAVDFAGTLAMDLLIASFFVGAGCALAAYWRRPTRAALDRFDAERFGLGLAAIVAIFVSVRFFWLACFPLAYLLALARGSTRVASARATPIAAAVACSALLVAFAGSSGFERNAALPGRYLDRPYVLSGYHPLGVRFLRATGVEGRLFNSYEEGGFLGFWLAPQLRTFIDSRTEHYTRAVAVDYTNVNEQRGDAPGRTFLDVLDRYRVDVFVGQGLPLQRLRAEHANYTTAHLEDAPGWIPVFRTHDQAVYLRSNARNLDNLARIASWYAREGVPFDRERGLVVADVIRARPDWAIEQALLPVDYERLRRESRSADPDTRFDAFDALGASYLAIGAYAEQLAADRACVALRPEVKEPRRRRVYGLLRTGRARRAVREARALLALDRDDTASKIFLRTALQRAAHGPDYSPSIARSLGELPVFTLEGARSHFTRRFAVVRPAADPSEGP